MKRVPLFLLLLIFATACNAPTLPRVAAPTPTAPPPAAPATPRPPTVTPIPAATPTPLPPTATPIPVDTAELSAQLMTELYPAGLPADGASITSIEVFPLNTQPPTPRLWAVYSTGMNGFTPDTPHHFIAIYGYDTSGWHKIDSTELIDPDILFTGSVQQVMLEPSHIWLSLEGGAGAHSGIFNLFMFDGKSLSLKLSGFNATPGVGNMVDLNNDGVLEVVLNATEPYVFCYACNVRLPMFSVYRWTGAELQPVELMPVGEDVPAEVRDLNNEMVSLANAWLWKDAGMIAESLSALEPESPTVRWNLQLMAMNTSALSDEIGVSSFPLLAYLFYGDYEGALALLRQYSADELPLRLVGSEMCIRDRESVLRDWIYQATDLALAKQPDIATAHFLRGWVTFINDGATDDVRAELAAAVNNAPDEALFLAAKGLLGD